MQSTYSLKDIAVSIALDVQGANNQYTFQGYATNVNISKTGGVDFATAQVEIFGLSLDTMAQLTTLAFKPLNRRWNAIEISAGEQGTELSSIFQGEVTVSYADLNGARPVLKIEAQTSAYNVLKPTPQIAVQGSQSVSRLCEQLCAECGYTFEAVDVDAQVADCVLTGDPITKMRQIARDTGSDKLIYDNRVVFMAEGSTRTEVGIPIVSAETGMIGYPTFTNQGVNAKSFFRPDLKIGGAVRLETIIPSASGVYKITQLVHELSAHNPGGGSWSTSFQGMWIEE